MTPQSGLWARMRDGIAIYGDRRIILIAIMGVSSGLPLLLTLSTLGAFLSTYGLNVSSIGLFAAVGTPYTIKFLWSPVIDKLPIPFFTHRFGQRRGWALVTQLLLMIAIGLLGFTNPAVDPLLTALVATSIGFLSASQDIVIDAIRIELLEQNDQGAGAASSQVGYKIGMALAGPVVFLLADHYDWSVVFLMLAAIIPFCMIGVLLCKEPTRHASATVGSIGEFFRKGVVDPFADFMRRPAALVILAFVLLYKFGDAISGTMATPFYLDMGFSLSEIGVIGKAASWIVSTIGVIVGGALVRYVGILKALIIGGVLQAATNFLFAWLAVSGTDLAILATAVWSDSFTGGLGSAAFVAYLSVLCNRDFTATQFALLTSFTAFGRTLLSTSSGFMVEAVGWPEFFILTAFLAVPGLLLIAFLARYHGGIPVPAADAADDKAGVAN